MDRTSSTPSPSADGWTCSVSWCDRNPRALGFCQTHYKQVKSGKEPGPIAPRRGGIPSKRCRHKGCDRRTVAKGYCQVHYYQERRNGVTVDIRPPGAPPVACSECDQPAMARGWCASHYRELWSRFAKYGLTSDSFDQILRQQGGGCAICKRVVPANKWHVDHAHSCCPGQSSCGSCVRGILCGTCNAGIGMLGDSPEILRSAADYIDRTTNRKEPHG